MKPFDHLSIFYIIMVVIAFIHFLSMLVKKEVPLDDIDFY